MTIQNGIDWGSPEFWVGVTLIVSAVLALVGYYVSVWWDERKKDPDRLQMK